MTFYNVIAGILFFGAFQSFIQALGTPTMWMTATLIGALAYVRTPSFSQIAFWRS